MMVKDRAKRCFFNDTATTEIYTLSLHDALPISVHAGEGAGGVEVPLRRRSIANIGRGDAAVAHDGRTHRPADRLRDRKSTRLNSSHANISYAVFCLKKKNTPSNLSTTEKTAHSS